MSGFMCGVGNWVAGLASYELTACKPDPKEIVVKQAQAALANALKNACRDGFVYIPAGAFVMGNENGSPGERLVRIISTDAYCIAKSETTNAQYNAVETAQKATRQDTRTDGGSRFNGANKPVINVNWKDADAYCKGIGGRLPTEAEWEKAARGPRGLAYGTESGEVNKKEEANYGHVYGGTKDVCSYPANDYGLCDAAGNVWEWTNDWYAAGAYELMKPQNPQGPDSGDSKVTRGGSRNSYTDYLRATHRSLNRPRDLNDDIGFRCVVGPKASK